MKRKRKIVLKANKKRRVKKKRTKRKRQRKTKWIST